MKQLEVSILGQVYMLGCPEGGEILLKAAVAAVDHEMSSIRDSGKVKARERIAVLAALNLAYQLAERGNAPPAVVHAVGHAVGHAIAPAAARTTGDPGGHADTADTAKAAAAIAALVRRVDAALGDDGQLL